MNNKERLFWLSGMIFLAFVCINKSNNIEELEILDRNNALAYRIQADQIDELDRKLHQIERTGYEEGFQEGKTHTLINLIHDNDLSQYADGYHAAIAQFSLDLKIGDSNLTENTYHLFYELLDMLEESNGQYDSLIESLSKQDE